MSAVKAEDGSGHHGGRPGHNDGQARRTAIELPGSQVSNVRMCLAELRPRLRPYSPETGLGRGRQSLSAAPSLELAHIINFRKAKITNVGHASLRLEEIHLDMGD